MKRDADATGIKSTSLRAGMIRNNAEGINRPFPTSPLTPSDAAAMEESALVAAIRSAGVSRNHAA